MKTFKVVLIGDTKAGKTALMKSLTSQEQPLITKETIGAQFFPIKLKVDAEEIKLQCWDTGCQQRFLSTLPIFINNSDVYIIAIDLSSHSDPATQVKYWTNFVKQKTQVPNPIFMLVGTKSDLDTDNQNAKVLTQHAQKNNIPCIITSAKKNTNINQVRTITGKLCLQPPAEKLVTEKTLLLRAPGASASINGDNPSDEKRSTRKWFFCC